MNKPRDLSKPFSSFKRLDARNNFTVASIFCASVRSIGIVKGGRSRWMCITWSGQVCEVGERMSAPLGEGADGNGVNGLSNPPVTLTRQDLSLFRRNLNTIRRWAAARTRTRNRSSLSSLSVQTYLSLFLYFYVHSWLCNLPTNFEQWGS